MKTYPHDPVNGTIASYGDGSNYTNNTGLTKREYFATMAMQGLIGEYSPNDVAEFAVRQADALIDELNKTK